MEPTTGSHLGGYGDADVAYAFRPLLRTPQQNISSSAFRIRNIDTFTSLRLMMMHGCYCTWGHCEATKPQRR